MERRQRVQGAGLDLAVTERGPADGPTVVLVHGFPDTSAVWTPVAERLAADHHVVTYDVRGAGASDAPSGDAGYRIPLLIDDLRAVVDATSPDAPVHLVGHDWGSVQSWSAVCSPRLEGRLASFTSISGPPLDHIGDWVRSKGRERAVGTLALQAMRSSYVAAMHVPGVGFATRRLAGRTGRSRSAWAAVLHRREHVPTDATWPGPTFGRDVANGMGLYRANVIPRVRRPTVGVTDVPTLLVIPTRDQFVPPSFLDGLERWPTDCRVERIDAGHWVPRSHPDLIAGLVAEHVAAHPAEALAES